MSGVDRVVAGQGPDPIQPVGDRPHGQMQPDCRRGGDAPAVEVRLEGVEKWSGTAAGLTERFKCRMNQVDDGWLVTEKDPIEEDIPLSITGVSRLMRVAMFSPSRASSYERAIPYAPGCARPTATRHGEPRRSRLSSA